MPASCRCLNNGKVVEAFQTSGVRFGSGSSPPCRTGSGFFAVRVELDLATIVRCGNKALFCQIGENNAGKASIHR